MDTSRSWPDLGTQMQFGSENLGENLEKADSDLGAGFENPDFSDLEISVIANLLFL